MKKLLLTGALSLGAFLTANAQADCNSAIPVAADMTYTVGTITGTYEANCFGGTLNNQNPQGPLMANWYSYTPTANGLLTISSNVAANPANTDTRLSVFTGTCGDLTCYNGNDDVSGTNYMSELTIPVESGVTYYIAWDNYWQSAGFDFTVSIEASSCLSPNSLNIDNFSDIGEFSAYLSWDAAIGMPANYDVEIGAPGYEAGTGTSYSTDTNSITLTDLPVTSNDRYDVYIRSNCGGTDVGEWVGPYYLYLAANTPYTNGFDTVGARLGGFTVESGWNTVTNAQAGGNIAQAGDGAVFSNTSTTAAADAWMFSRAINLDAGAQATLTFYTAVFSSGTVTANLEITAGMSPTIEAQGDPIATIAATGSTYTQQTVTFTAPTSGVYHFGFHQNTPTTTAAASLLVDTVEVLGGVAATESAVASQFSVFPNPATNVINIANADNALVNGVAIVDLNGRTVKSVKFDGVANAEINVADLASGVYIMTIASDKGTATKKIVKN